MEENIEVKVAAAVLKFLQQHELQKTAKALLKEAGKRDWVLDEEETEDQQFDLIKLYAAKQRRVNKRALVNAVSGRAGSELGAKNSRKAQNADEGEETQSKKKCRMHKDSETPDAAALSTSVNNSDKSVLPHKKGNKQNFGREEDVEENKPANTQKNGGIRRFQRIDDAHWTTGLPDGLKDNSFWKKKNDSFAVQAAEQLGRVRGKDFRHEKTKKKKATWKGCGELPMTVNSIQFASDSD